MSQPWFRPKTHGYGAYPAGWKGWAAIAAFGVADLVIVYFTVLGPVLHGEGPGVIHMVLFCVLTLAATAVFLWLCKAKTDGPWRWRWGGN